MRARKAAAVLAVAAVLAGGCKPVDGQPVPRKPAREGDAEFDCNFDGNRRCGPQSGKD